jgi:hypothetical protein
VPREAGYAGPLANDTSISERPEVIVAGDVAFRGQQVVVVSTCRDARLDLGITKSGDPG